MSSADKSADQETVNPISAAQLATFMNNTLFNHHSFAYLPTINPSNSSPTPMFGLEEASGIPLEKPNNFFLENFINQANISGASDPSTSSLTATSHLLNNDPTENERVSHSTSTQNSYNSEAWLEESKDFSSPNKSKNNGKDGTTPITSPQPDDDNLTICNVCGDEASGRHYGAATCFGCKGFFRRTVRANKTYSCRYEERCEIDKVGRNICRACRFRKCLNVGMEPDAIRPDRDKTGRQKNPRRISTLSTNSQENEKNDLLPNFKSDPDAMDIATSHAPVTDTTQDLRSEDSADSSASTTEKDLILQTLLEIEKICNQLKDFKTETEPHIDRNSQMFSLTDILHQPSLIAQRTEIDYSGKREISHSTEFQDGFCRLMTLSIDYFNTLKPIADLLPEEKIVLLQSFLAPFIVFSTAFQSINAGRPESILLPNGHFLRPNAPLTSFIELPEMFDKNTIQSLAVRINFICNSIVDALQYSLKQLRLSEVEYVSMKAVIALDPSIRGVSQETSTILSGARDSVQNALFLHLMDHYPSQKAVARYGRILMLSANVWKIGAFLSSVIDIIQTIRPSTPSNALVFQFFNNLDSSNLVNLRSSVYCTS